ncbi:hypothetical protein DFH09DRAFT_1326720 [Mycena vulgaris]|nr:hypothetical protein DFH09DRAFT_1326720 [Mycena vulgaris]
MEELAIWFSKDDGREVLIHVESLRVRSQCTPRRLSIRGSPDTYTTAKILRLSPSIVQLGILLKSNDSGETNTLMSALTIHNFIGRTPTAPQLRGLFFGCERGSYIDYALHLQMLQSRWQTDDRALEAAALMTESGRGPDPGTLDDFRNLRQDGLDLVVLEGWEAHDHIKSNRWMFA